MKLPAEPPALVVDQWTSWWFWVLVLAPVLLNAIWLAPQLSGGIPSRNDNALHLLMIHAASDALSAGHNPFDFWIPQLELGFPQFLYYQHLPHLAVVALHRALFGMMELGSVFQLVQYLLLVCFPLTVAWSMRRMGFSAVAAGVSAAAATLLSASLKYGFEYNSYVWRGVGLYTQLWGMHLSFLALAGLVGVLNEGRGYVRTAIFLAALALSHLVYAYMMVVTSVIVLVIGARTATLLPRTVRLMIVGTIAVVLSAYMLWPFLESSQQYLSNLPGLNDGGTRSVARATTRAFSGSLLDNRRWPVLTILAGIGVVAAAMRRGPARVLALSGLAIWLVLYLGRPLGAFGDLLPSHKGFVSFRFSGAVGLFAILVIGVGGEAFWDAIARWRVLAARWRPALALLIIGLVLAPAAVERASYYRANTTRLEKTKAAVLADTDLRSILDSLSAHPGGRVFAGTRSGWGRQMRVDFNLAVNDVVNLRRLPAIGNPFQGLALNSGLLFSFRDGDPGLYDAYDVRTVITTATATVPPFFTPRFRTSRYVAWSVPTSGVAQFVEVTARKTAKTQRELYRGNVDWFTSTAPSAHQVTRWDYGTPAGTFTPQPRCPDGGRTLDETVGSQSIAVVVQCPTAATLVLKMSFHPNWRVQVDGRATPTFMVSPSFVAVDVPAGRHRVEAHYVPTRSKMPLLALGLLVLAFAIRYRARLDGPARWAATRWAHPIG